MLDAPTKGPDWCGKPTAKRWGLDDTASETAVGALIMATGICAAFWTSYGMVEVSRMMNLSIWVRYAKALPFFCNYSVNTKPIPAFSPTIRSV